LSQPITYAQTLSALEQAPKASLTFYRGIEKEGLRVNADTRLSQVPHQTPLGSALTHPYITTDYSESLLEFITPVKDNAKDVLAFLQIAHSYTYQYLGDELIWPASMPGKIEDELEVPIAYFGSSNVGTLKHVYRHGLWHRYGRKMQCIAGLHYNFSVSDELWQQLADLQGKSVSKDFMSEGYFGLIRNFRRHSWLLLYLFGASPVLDKSFIKGEEHPLKELDNDSLYLPYATSLRMSGLGYQNNAQDGLFVCFNGLPTYTRTLHQAMQESVAGYEAMGVRKDGEYQQLNTNLLQIENEYYSDIRPKRNPKNGEKPLTALNEHGVEYIEVRCLDLNPFAPLGIDEEQIHFMDLFLSFCLLNPSPMLGEDECSEVARNQHDVVLDGRNPSFTLQRLGETVALKDWAKELIANMQPLADLLDTKQNVSHYNAALTSMNARVDDAALTPSAQVLATMKQKNQSFCDFASEQAQTIAKTHTAILPAETLQEWQQLAQKSLQKQQDIERADDVNFDQYLAEYAQKA
jgi:glutamate--cysteine ligase